MDNQIKRLEQDRALFIQGSRQQLYKLVAHGNPRLVTGAITRVLELQIAIEEIARAEGVDINDGKIAEYTKQNREQLEKEVDCAVNAFIMSIVSQEG